MPHQLPLEFNFNNELTFETFVTGGNAELVSLLKNFSNRREADCLYYWGRPGFGKTHLLQALCQDPSFKDKPVAMIPLDTEMQTDPYSPQMLDGLESMGLVCIDDIDLIAGNRDWENALFHFYNRARDNSTPLVISASVPPAQLSIELSDLKTRLGWGLVLQLQAINDDEKLEALKLRARHRGMEVSDEVGEYLLRRFSRNMPDLVALLDNLDRASLTEQRRLTIPFIKQVLEKDPEGTGDAGGG